VASVYPLLFFIIVSVLVSDFGIPEGKIKAVFVWLDSSLNIGSFHLFEKLRIVLLHFHCNITEMPVISPFINEIPYEFKHISFPFFAIKKGWIISLYISHNIRILHRHNILQAVSVRHSHGYISYNSFSRVHSQKAIHREQIGKSYKQPDFRI
jgi:hypothetical protein